MKSNKLIYIFLLAGLASFSSQSFAIPVTMDAEGSVSSYSYFGSVDPFAGSINVGSAFSSMTVLDPDTAVDYVALDGVGRYYWGGDIFNTTANIGGNSLNTNGTNLTILNNYNIYGDVVVDQYRIDSWATSQNENLLFNIILSDNTGQAFNNDNFVLEPDLSLFNAAYFQIRSWDSDWNLNYNIMGSLTSLVDPPLQIASVPEPDTIFLLGLGLIAVFFASKKGTTRETRFMS